MLFTFFRSEPSIRFLYVYLHIPWTKVLWARKVTKGRLFVPRSETEEARRKFVAPRATIIARAVWKPYQKPHERDKIEDIEGYSYNSEEFFIWGNLYWTNLRYFKINRDKLCPVRSNRVALDPVVQSGSFESSSVFFG